MNTRRLIGLLLLALLASWPILRGCTPEEPAPATEPPRLRETFHAAKPLHLVVSAEQGDQSDAADYAWLERELRHLLNRGRMRIAAVGIAVPAADEPSSSDVPIEQSKTGSGGTRPASPQAPANAAFILRVDIVADGSRARLQLVAPDEHVERDLTVELDPSSRLQRVAALARSLPRFLDASHVAEDWVSFIGTTDEHAYDSYLSSANDLFGSAGRGFTRPPASLTRARTVERLEALGRGHPGFGRVWSALSAGYLSLGGEDVASLSELAESAAERALRLNQQDAVAHAALGLVHLRRNDWIAAHEKFTSALALDANLVPALEGLACLYVDAGHYRAALRPAGRAVALQPRNVGANECLTFAQTTSTDDVRGSTGNDPIAPVARVRALAAFLSGERRVAEQLLRRAMSRAEFDIWADPVIRAADNPRLITEALKAITRAASDGYIDAATEILCGTALRQPEFVFNRIARLQRENAHAPLRLLWLPDAAFLRSHPRFEATISKAGLPGFWHGSGLPDVCVLEPTIYGCDIRSGRPSERRLATE